MITLGKKYRDTITGFEGIATGFCTYISGCNQVLLAPRTKKGGELIESHWFDEQRLVDLPGTRVVLENGRTPGFDKAPPVR